MIISTGNMWLIPFDLDMMLSTVLDGGEHAAPNERFEYQVREDCLEEFIAAFEEHIQRLRSTVEQLIANREKREGGQGGG